MVRARCRWHRMRERVARQLAVARSVAVPGRGCAGWGALILQKSHLAALMKNTTTSTTDDVALCRRGATLRADCGWNALFSSVRLRASLGEGAHDAGSSSPEAARGVDQPGRGVATRAIDARLTAAVISMISPKVTAPMSPSRRSRTTDTARPPSAVQTQYARSTRASW